MGSIRKMKEQQTSDKNWKMGQVVTKLTTKLTPRVTV